MSDKPRRDRYRFPESRDSRIAMVATLAVFLVVMLIFIVIIFRGVPVSLTAWVAT